MYLPTGRGKGSAMADTKLTDTIWVYVDGILMTLTEANGWDYD